MGFTLRSAPAGGDGNGNGRDEGNGRADGHGRARGDGGGDGAGRGARPAIRLQRTPLREQIRDILREWLVVGEIPPGEDLNEREIGDRLGSSRTPVREALLLLAVEGLVSVRPNEGYYVAHLTRDEGEDLYGLLGLVERRALQRVGVPSDEVLERLAVLDRERQAADDAADRLELDRAWHAELLPRAAIGAVYAEEIERLENRAARYERAFLEDEADQAGALAEHRAIRDALARGELEEAGRILEQHWLRGASYAARWPRDEESSSPEAGGAGRRTLSREAAAAG
ncbi:MAG TPA: GntR family transcriptional regulator [Gemmatimonadota bacterium]|nr:GntR family transcriptional regulator [Gemmatimonadota bacterium]